MSPSDAAAATTAQSPNPNPSSESNQTVNSNSSYNNISFNFAGGRNEDLNLNFSCSFPAKLGSEKETYERRKPRLVKMRKKTSKQSDVKVGDSNFIPFAAICNGSKNHTSEEANCAFASTYTDSKCTANGNHSVNENLKFKSFQSSVGGFVFGDTNSGSMSNSNVENVGFGIKENKRSGMLDFIFGNEAFGFGSDKSSAVPNWNAQRRGFMVGENKGGDMSNSNVVNEGIVFGVDKSMSRLNLNMDNVGFIFGENKSGLSTLNKSPLKGGCGFCENKDDFLGNVKMDRGAFGLGAECAKVNTYKQDGDRFVFGSGKFEFGSNVESFLEESAGNVEQRRANENGKNVTSKESGGMSGKKLAEELHPVAGDGPHSDVNGSIDKDVGFGGNSKPSDEMNQSNSVKSGQMQSSMERPGHNVQGSPLFMLSDEMKRFTIHHSETTGRTNEPEDASNDFFVDVDTKFVFGSNKKGVKNRSLGDKRSKGSKIKLRQGNLAQHLTGQDHMYKGGIFQKNDESSGCYSPMDFSPYQTTDAEPSSAAFRGEGTAAGQGHDICASDRTSEGFQSSISETNCQSHCNGERSDISASSSGQDGLSAIRHQYKKKYKLKVGNSSSHITEGQKAGLTSSSGQSSARMKNALNSQSKGKNPSKINQEHEKPGAAEFSSDEVCDNWRIRGNQAYKAGDLSKAEEFYTKGIDSVPDKVCMQPLLLCYSNRAATRMSLGRIREALSDCTMAAALDPSFLKVKLRAANCHLVLGEVEDSITCYNNCLESEVHVCLDRRITIEAADGLQKAQRVAEYMHQSAELLQKSSPDAATSALGVIAEALKISCYSDKLFKMKGEALCMLSMYDEVIQLCEQTLHIAETNFMAHVEGNDRKGQESFPRLWRWCLMTKSQYHLGKLEVALDLIEKQEQLISTVNKMTQKSSVSLAVTIRQLLSHKKAGNEAFRSGRHGEAVEHYTAAISKCVDSRPFAAICFCNRAAAYQAMGQIVDAIADCSLAIALDEKYPKAVSRRAALHELIRDYEQAVNDIVRLIFLLENQPQHRAQQPDVHDRSSGSSTKDLQRARNRLSSVEKKSKREVSLDLYLILGVKATDTEADIKKAYRKAALRHHPDKAAQLLAKNDVGDDGKLWKEIVEKVHKDADRLFKMIGEAYGVLSDPGKRLKYNDEEELRDVLRSQNKSNHSGRSSEFQSSPFEGFSRSGRQSDFHGSPFGRRGNRGYWQEESWRGYDSSRSRW